jgi:hypothetical protein
MCEQKYSTRLDLIELPSSSDFNFSNLVTWAPITGKGCLVLNRIGVSSIIPKTGDTLISNQGLDSFRT